MKFNFKCKAIGAAVVRDNKGDTARLHSNLANANAQLHRRPSQLLNHPTQRNADANPPAPSLRLEPVPRTPRAPRTPSGQARNQLYILQEKIGKGVSGKVHRAEVRRTGEIVALKKIKIEDEGIPCSALREMSLLKTLNHPNVIKLLNVEIGEEAVHLIFEYIDRELKDLLNTPLPPRKVKQLLYQILSGLDYCHTHGVMHRDLKPQNILVDHRGRLYLADFGLGREFRVPRGQYTHEVVTLYYRAPEILLGAAEYSQSVDMWSVGCIFAEMAESRILFRGDSEIDQLFKIFRVLGTPTEQSFPGVTTLRDFKASFPKWRHVGFQNIVTRLDMTGLDLLSKMLCYDPAQRISARAALDHPYFED